MAQNAASPLAQIFQPLLMDDDGPDGEDAQDGGHANGLVSYGPASRRRLSSMPRRPAAAADPFGVGSSHSQAGAMRRPPVSPISRTSSARGLGAQLSASPDQHSHLEHLETAEEAEEDRPVWMTRLDEIEQRHRRMEDMLAQILDRLAQ